MNKNELFNVTIVPHLEYIKQLVKRYCYQTNEVDDVFQEVCVSLYSSIENIDSSKNLTGYLHVSVKHQCYKHYLKGQKPLTFSNIYGTEKIERATERNISDFKRLLSPRQRTILLLRLNGYNCKEIAQKLHIGNYIYKRKLESIKLSYKKYINYGN